MTKKDKTDYKNRYNKENYARIGLYIKPELKEKIQKRADAAGKSLNQYIIDCIEEREEDGDRIK